MSINDMKVHSHFEIAREQAMGGWGKKAESLAAAVQSSGTVDPAAQALFEIVRRINQAIEAWAKDSSAGKPHQPSTKRPANAVTFADVQIGDSLYYCGDLEEGVCRYIVFAKDAEGYVQLIAAHSESEKSTPQVVWGHDDNFRTEKEAVEFLAKKDWKFFEKGFRKCNAVLAAIAKNKPYAHLIGEDAKDSGEGDE